MRVTYLESAKSFQLRGFIPVLLMAALLGFAAPAPVTFAYPDASAKEALALMLDNQNRCYLLADTYRKLLSKYSGQKFGPEKASEAFATQARHRTETASRSLRTISGLMNKVQGVAPETLAALDSMFRSQKDLYGLVTEFTVWESRAEFDAAVAQARSEFNVARSEVAASLHLSTREQREISVRYERKIAGLTKSSKSSSASSREEHHDPLAREMSAEEFQKEKEEYEDWLAEQERRRFEKARRLREQQAAEMAEEEEDKPAVSTAPRPTVGVSIPPSKMPPPQEHVEAMWTWHRRYSSKVYAVKMSISQYLQVRHDGTSIMVGRSCAKMSESLTTLLADPMALSSPEPKVKTALETAMNEFKKGADLCRIQPYAEQVQIHMSAAEKALTEAAMELKRFQLAP